MILGMRSYLFGKVVIPYPLVINLWFQINWFDLKHFMIFDKVATAVEPKSGGSMSGEVPSY